MELMCSVCRKKQNKVVIQGAAGGVQNAKKTEHVRPAYLGLSLYVGSNAHLLLYEGRKESGKRE